MFRCARALNKCVSPAAGFSRARIYLTRANESPLARPVLYGLLAHEPHKLALTQEPRQQQHHHHHRHHLFGNVRAII